MNEVNNYYDFVNKNVLRASKEVSHESDGACKNTTVRFSNDELITISLLIIVSPGGSSGEWKNYRRS